MICSAAGLRQLDAIIWTAIAFVAAFVVAAAAFGGFRIVPETYIAPAGICLLLKLAARYYRDRRDDHNLASALESTAQLIAFVAVGAPLSYVAASPSLPLQDAALARLDQALGFDWIGLLAFMHRWPGFFSLMHVVYPTLPLQMAAAVLLLGFTGRQSWLRIFMLAFIFAALITIAISAFLPAQGAWLYYGIKDDAYAMPLGHTSWRAVFFGLRDGSFRLLAAVDTEGIITFPSLHAALAVILVVALWPVPIARWVAVAINSLMLMSTPIDGSHYLVDILAGIGIAAFSFAAALALMARVALRPAVMATRYAPGSWIIPIKS
jgi:PAP2 superfamily